MSFNFTNLQVIWAIGFSMVILGLVIYLPKRLILILGLLLVFGHNALDGITRNGQDIISVIWYMLHQSNGISLGSRFVWFAYPVLPWIGVMLLGYCFGDFYKKGALIAFRKKWLLYLGFGSIVLFFIFRGFNFYADLSPWTTQETTTKTIISFFNVTKYPPSLDFLLITLGPAFLFLYGIENIKNKITDFLLVFGRVPFFYYILHIFIIHIGAIIGLLITGKDWKIMIFNQSAGSSNPFVDYGYSLGITYLIWIGIVALLYPICKRYMNYKISHKNKWWLSYL